MRASKRFSSEFNANSFAKKVNGNVSDLRSNENRKSDFKVTYEKRSWWDLHDDNAAYDFDSDINMNGTHWHTAEDL